MKKCVKCNTKYTDDVEFCSSCGSKLQKVNEKDNKNNKKNIDIVRYIIGSIIILVNIIRIQDIGIVAILGFAFGISLFPIVYDLIFKDNDKTKKIKYLLSIFIPIILGIIWLIILPGEKLKEIRIINLDVPITVNETKKIEFETNLSKLDGRKFLYESSNKEIAVVDSNGEITGKAEGKVIISVVGDDNVKTEKEITIRYIDIEKIILLGDTQIEVGKTGNISYKTEPEFVSDKIVKWESSNPDIVSINDNGDISANSQGKVTITAVSEKGKKETVEVKSYIKVESLKISKDSLKIEKTKTAQLSVSIIPENADSSGITWSSSDNYVAKVSDKGLVTAVGEGTAIITAESGNGVKATCSIEVYEVKPESIKLSKTSLSLMKGETAKITATISPNNASDKSIRWSSSSSYVASVENGKIKAEGRGTTTITATTSNGKSASVDVTVKEKSPITIKGFKFTKDYVCGVEWNFSITNNTKKQINYINLKWYNFNGVGDYVYDRIDGKNYTALRYTGPLKAGKNSGSKRNTTKFYNCDYKYSTFSEIKIEYADGTTDTIYNSEFNEYTGILK